MKSFLSKRSLKSSLTAGGTSNQDGKFKTESEGASASGLVADTKLLSVASEPSMKKQVSKSQGQFDDSILKRAEKSFGGFLKAFKNEKEENQKMKSKGFSNSFNNMSKTSGDVSSPKMVAQTNGAFLNLPNLKSPDDQRLSTASYDGSSQSLSQGNLEELFPSPNSQYFYRKREGEKSLDDLSPDVLTYICTFLPSNLESIKEYYRDSYEQLLEIRKRIKLNVLNENGKHKIESMNSKQKRTLKKLLYSKKEITRSFGLFSLCFTNRYFYEELFQRVSFWQSLCEVCNKIDLRTWDSLCINNPQDAREHIEMWQNIYRYYNEYSARWENHPEIVHSAFKLTQNDLKIKRNCKKSKLNTSQANQPFEFKEEFKELLNGGIGKDSLCAISSNSLIPGNLYYVECVCKFSSMSSRMSIGIMPDSDCFFKERHDPVPNTDYSFTSFDDITSPLRNICRNSLNMSNHPVNQSTIHHYPFNPKEYTSPDILCLSMLENMEDSQLFLSGDKISIIIDYAFSEKNVLKLHYCNNWDTSKERKSFSKSIERIKLHDKTTKEGCLPQNMSLQDEKVLAYLVKDEIPLIQKECKKGIKNMNGDDMNVNQPFEDRISEPFKKYNSRHIYFLSKYRNSTEQNYQYPKGYKSNARKEIISFFKVEEKNESLLPTKSLSSAFDPTKERPTICTADLYLPNLKLCMSSQEVGDSCKIVKPSLPYPPFFYHILRQNNNSK